MFAFFAVFSMEGESGTARAAHLGCPLYAISLLFSLKSLNNTEQSEQSEQAFKINGLWNFRDTEQTPNKANIKKFVARAAAPPAEFYGENAFKAKSEIIASNKNTICNNQPKYKSLFLFASVNDRIASTNSLKNVELVIFDSPATIKIITKTGQKIIVIIEKNTTPLVIRRLDRYLEREAPISKYRIT